MQIELTVSELAKCTNMKILFAIYFNSPCIHAIFRNFYKMPRHEVLSVPRAVYTRELLHPSVKRNRVRGSSCSYTHGSCSLRRGGVWQLLLQGSLTQPKNAVTATLPFTNNILHPDTTHSSIKKSWKKTLRTIMDMEINRDWIEQRFTLWCSIVWMDLIPRHNLSFSSRALDAPAPDPSCSWCIAGLKDSSCCWTVPTVPHPQHTGIP